ncbi:ATP-dependent protease LonB [Candidatus Woesearchaeota archaeon]|nr:ATP-dependent protease LonB [Candidatus Woesearchaeota archaeon]
MKYNTTADINISDRILDQIIGQNEAISLLNKVAQQRRHLLLIGEPGTGKSLIGQALADLLPKEKLVDIMALPNQTDENQPLIRTAQKGKGQEIIFKAKLQSASSTRIWNIFIMFLPMIILGFFYYYWKKGEYSDVIFAAGIISSLLITGIAMFSLSMSKRMNSNKIQVPKLVVDNSETKHAPFIDATGAHAGALLGDVLHDPLQSGGLGTPPHERVISGMIHRANKGVLFIDEIAILEVHSQQELLTALQEKKLPITGQSERSSGAMVRTEPVPCDFILIAAGNLETLKNIHPALRSRITGYGYEIYMNTEMEDNPINRFKIAQFVAQEVKKDEKIPHFKKEAVEVIIDEAKRMSGKAGKLTVRFRALGGLVRAAGDLANNDKSKYVEAKHVHDAKIFARSLEKQIADKYIVNKKEYEIIRVTGTEVGRVNGLAVIGDTVNASFSGILLPIESEVTIGGKKAEFIATGKLGEIAKEAVKNVSAIILKMFGEDIKEKHDIYVQFIQTYEGVEGDSASIAVATAIISALKQVPVRQDTAMTGSLSIRGEVMAVGGVSAKVEAAVDAGIKRVIIPRANEKDVLLSEDKRSKIKLIPVSMISDVLKEALDWKGKESILNKIK